MTENEIVPDPIDSPAPPEGMLDMIRNTVLGKGSFNFGSVWSGRLARRKTPAHAQSYVTFFTGHAKRRPSAAARNLARQRDLSPARAVRLSAKLRAHNLRRTPQPKSHLR